MRRDEERGASEWGGGRAERATNEWIREPRAVERVESRVSGFVSRGASVLSGRLQCIITVSGCRASGYKAMVEVQTVLQNRNK
jgi:hypothetical protein